MLTLVHEGKVIELQPDTLLILQKADLALYEKLATEDLKIDFDGRRLYIHSPASFRHEKIVHKVIEVFEKYFALHPGKGEVVGSFFSIKLPDEKRVEPDIVIIPPGIEPEASVYEGVPLLIIEVISPSNRDHDLIEKKGWYEENRVPEYWFIDPENGSVTVTFLKPNGKYAQEITFDRKIKSRVLAEIEFSPNDFSFS